MGCLNVNEKLILKYLNLSPATAKGHMKRPRHGIWSMTPKTPLLGIAPIPVVSVLHGPNLIGIDDNESIANVFCFGAFADKTTGWCTMI